MLKIKIKILLITVITCLAPCNEGSAKSIPQKKCNIHDLQSCHSCEALSNTLNLETPNDGEYYRGTFWNGLYSAYRLNCQTVGKNLLIHHANPNLGGSSGSFLASVVSSWPHNKVKINTQWLKIISKYEIDPHWKNPYSGESAIEIIKNDEVPLDYPKLWKKILVNKSK